MSQALCILTKHHLWIALALSFVLDLLLGDPRFLYHPVRLIGRMIDGAERLFRRLGKGRRAERLGGLLLVLLVAGLGVAIPFLILWIAFRLNFWLGFAVEVFWCWQLLACRSLWKESEKVRRRLAEEDLAGARRAVSMIVGRDTEALDESGVTRATVETIAESTSDGVVAPLLFLAIFGPVGGFFYKAVNTMDSMIGYRNDKYRYFGTAAARLDDVLNFIPARLAGLLMVAASFLLCMDGKNSWRVFRRDRLSHASPNSAHTEAAMAGALDVQLAGPASYFGVVHDKPTIGDPIRPVEAEDIRRANRLMVATSVLACVLFVVLRAIVTRLAV